MWYDAITEEVEREEMRLCPCGKGYVGHADHEFMFCPLQGKNVPMSECHDSCAAPEQRPVCWLGKMYRDEPLEGGS